MPSMIDLDTVVDLMIENRGRPFDVVELLQTEGLTKMQAMRLVARAIRVRDDRETKQELRYA